MIVGFEELQRYRGAVAMVDGGFDPLHRGHLAYFREAAKLGLPLLCNVASDAYVARKHPPLLSAEQRAGIIDALRQVAFTHVSVRDTETTLRELRPRYYVKGKDWQGRLPPEQQTLCGELGIEVVFVDTVLESSGRILERYLAAAADRSSLDAFERLVLGQRAVGGSAYDDEYFTGGWRAGGNSYTLEARRRIEARHPALVKEVFGGGSILDVGCGPGALMQLLHELGIEADGLDHSERARELAPPEVRAHIRVGSIAEPILPDASYDVVICREVLEHLTVLQVRRAVANLCRLSARYVYVTTRFHPSPGGLLDVTDEADVDPSHITLLSKDLLRLLFVLEGFRRRSDLEQRLDWLNKGRVLVYERVAPASP